MTEKQLDPRAAFQVQGLRMWGSRAAMMVGFGALLLVMAIICIDSLNTLGAFKAVNTQIRNDFLYRERALERVRVGLYESDSIIRGYILIASDPRAQKMLRDEFLSIRNETTLTLNSCIQSLPPGRQEPFQHLASELNNYWSTIGPVMDSDLKDVPGESALRSEVLSQLAEILAITKDVSAVNDDDLKEAERRMAEVSARFRIRLQAAAAVAFGCGLILATATILYAGKLETNLEKKYQESLQAQHDLKELSKRLVDAEESERRTISRELHDQVGQSLSALLMDIESLTTMAADQSAFRQAIQKIKTLAESCVNEVRNMALLLRPSMLDDLGLVAALEWQGREVSKRTGMLVDTVEHNVSDNLPEEQKTCVYRIVQEALTNCSKHSHAKKVRVAVSQEADHLFVSIEDDGRGFDPSRARGLGLLGMSERVGQLGGILKIDSDPAHGTRLRIDLPLPSASMNREG